VKIQLKNFQRNCLAGALIIPGQPTTTNVALDNFETFCGTYLNSVPLSIAGGVVTSMIRFNLFSSFKTF
jgi:hypothetical protein